MRVYVWLVWMNFFGLMSCLPSRQSFLHSVNGSESRMDGSMEHEAGAYQARVFDSQIQHLDGFDLEPRVQFMSIDSSLCSQDRIWLPQVLFVESSEVWLLCYETPSDFSVQPTSVTFSLRQPMDWPVTRDLLSTVYSDDDREHSWMAAMVVSLPARLFVQPLFNLRLNFDDQSLSRWAITTNPEGDGLMGLGRFVLKRVFPQGETELHLAQFVTDRCMEQGHAYFDLTGDLFPVDVSCPDYLQHCSERQVVDCE